MKKSESGPTFSSKSFALFNALNVPTPQTRQPPSRSHSNCSTNSALERILSVDSDYDPKHTPVVKSVDQSKALADAFKAVQELEVLAREAKKSKKRISRKPPRRSKSVPIEEAIEGCAIDISY